MKTPGFLTDTLFYLRTLTTISVLSIGLQISSMVRSTSDENTFGNYENLEVEVGELKVKATGKNTTEVLIYSMQNVLKVLEVIPFSDAKSSPYTPLKVVPTTKKHVGLFLNNVLSESLDDGTPKYYNSNILGRYYRKDYYEPE